MEGDGLPKAASVVTHMQFGPSWGPNCTRVIRTALGRSANAQTHLLTSRSSPERPTRRKDKPTSLTRPVRRLAATTLAALAVALLAAAPQTAAAAATLGNAPGGLLALTAGRGQAYAVLGSGDPAVPFRLVRSTGRGASSIGRFGVRGARFPDVAAAAGSLVVAYGRVTSDGLLYESSLAQAGGFEAHATLGQSTGPARLALDGPARLVAFPDLLGDAVLGGRDATDAPVRELLSNSAPARRHMPLDLVVDDGRVLVLDLVQSATRSELCVVGPGAPARAVLSVPGVQALAATLAYDGERLYVAYSARGRAVLASARPTPGATWSRRRLAAHGRLAGAPAVARVGLRTIVATSERVDGQREIYVTKIGPGGTVVSRLTRSRADDLAPQATVGLDDTVYVGWTRRDRARSGATALLQRVG